MWSPLHQGQMQGQLQGQTQSRSSSGMRPRVPVQRMTSAPSAPVFWQPDGGDQSPRTPSNICNPSSSRGRILQGVTPSSRNSVHVPGTVDMSAMPITGSPLMAAMPMAGAQSQESLSLSAALTSSLSRARSSSLDSVSWRDAGRVVMGTPSSASLSSIALASAGQSLLAPAAGHSAMAPAGTPRERAFSTVTEPPRDRALSRVDVNERTRPGSPPPPNASLVSSSPRLSLIAQARQLTQPQSTTPVNPRQVPPTSFVVHHTAGNGSLTTVASGSFQGTSAAVSKSMSQVKVVPPSTSPNAAARSPSPAIAENAEVLSSSTLAPAAITLRESTRMTPRTPAQTGLMPPAHSPGRASTAFSPAKTLSPDAGACHDSLGGSITSNATRPPMSSSHINLFSRGPASVLQADYRMRSSLMNMEETLLRSEMATTASYKAELQEAHEEMNEWVNGVQEMRECFTREMGMCVEAMAEMREIFIEEMHACRSMGINQTSAWHSVQQPISEERPGECEDALDIDSQPTINPLVLLQELAKVDADLHGPGHRNATVTARLQLSEAATALAAAAAQLHVPKSELVADLESDAAALVQFAESEQARHGTGSYPESLVARHMARLPAAFTGRQPLSAHAIALKAEIEAEGNDGQSPKAEADAASASDMADICAFASAAPRPEDLDMSAAAAAGMLTAAACHHIAEASQMYFASSDQRDRSQSENSGSQSELAEAARGGTNGDSRRDSGTSEQQGEEDLSSGQPGANSSDFYSWYEPELFDGLPEKQARALVKLLQNSERQRVQANAKAAQLKKEVSELEKKLHQQTDLVNGSPVESSGSH